MRVLVVEDETVALEFLSKALERHCFIVKAAKSLKRAKELLLHGEFDLIILDRNFPNEEDGLELCKRLRECQKNILIMILTGQIGAKERTVGFEMGADDYVEKPYNLSELTARIFALLRRREKKFFHNKVGPFEIDEQKNTIYFKNKQLDLRLREYQLLNYFLRNANRIITETELLEHVWDDDQFSTRSNTLNAHLSKVRKKIPQEKDWIKTMKGMGYIFEY